MVLGQEAATISYTLIAIVFGYLCALSMQNLLICLAVTSCCTIRHEGAPMTMSTATT